MRILSTLFLALAALPAVAASPPFAGAAGSTCTASSRSVATPLVELYTSEGCDSCPPADRWFSTLKAEAARGTVVPLAFHVDYWDYLGWKDRFGDPAFGVRHREVVGRSGATAVYTPQVLFDGREFMQWRRTNGAKTFGNDKPKAAGAQLRVTARAAGAAQLQVNVAGRALRDAGPARAYVAVYENGLASDVKAGENRGVRLTHDFVVRRWLGPFGFDGSGTLTIAESVSVPADTAFARAGIAVVAVDGRGRVLQSLALPLRDCAG